MITQHRAGRAAFVFLVVLLGLSGLAQAAVTLSGQPQRWIRAGDTYLFEPEVSGVSGAVSFAIRNKPEWASFDARTGRLSGTPSEEDAGWYNYITIYARDRHSRAKLHTYNLRVAPNKLNDDNAVPRISGSAPASAYVGRGYYFKPTARDADGDKLTFSVSNAPEWSRFNPHTGTLYGTPTVAGTNSDIVISVTDGKAMASLGAFGVRAVGGKGAVVLSWNPPTHNVDETVLTDLAGYQIAYGTAAHNLNRRLHVPDAQARSVAIEELDAGPYYFAIRSYTAAGLESERSSLVYTLVH